MEDIRFTSREANKTKKDILENFRVGSIDAMVAIRCLDEIDIPACRTAFLLASTRNPRQFIQRRGRILRRATEKNLQSSTIFLSSCPKQMTRRILRQKKEFGDSRAHSDC